MFMLRQTAEIDQLHGVVNTLAGVEMQQTWHALYALNRFLSEESKIKQIIELGTAKGGLTVFFGMEMRSCDGEVHSFDIEPPTGDFERFRGILPIVFYKKSVFDEFTVKLVQKLLKPPNKTLIFCDNGNKIKELDLYAPLLKRGDYIMAHDYRTEVLEPDVKKLIEKHNLKLCKQDLFDKYSTHIISLIR